MMVRIHGKLQFECDGCGDVLDAETGDFGIARTMLARESWVTRKIGTDWCHFCRTCPSVTRTGKAPA